MEKVPNDTAESKPSVEELGRYIAFGLHKTFANMLLVANDDLGGVFSPAQLDFVQSMATWTRPASESQWSYLGRCAGLLASVARIYAKESH